MLCVSMFCYPDWRHCLTQRSWVTFITFPAWVLQERHWESLTGWNSCRPPDAHFAFLEKQRCWDAVAQTPPTSSYWDDRNWGMQWVQQHEPPGLPHPARSAGEKETLELGEMMREERVSGTIIYQLGRQSKTFLCPICLQQGRMKPTGAGTPGMAWSRETLPPAPSSPMARPGWPQTSVVEYELWCHQCTVARPATKHCLNRKLFGRQKLSLELGKVSSTSSIRETQKWRNRTNVTGKENNTHVRSGGRPPECTLLSAPAPQHGNKAMDRVHAVALCVSELPQNFQRSTDDTLLIMMAWHLMIRSCLVLSYAFLFHQ